jgi:hypothetical protein
MATAELVQLFKPGTIPDLELRGAPDIAICGWDWPVARGKWLRRYYELAT